jgi:carboxymethylenebutenolidase
MLETTLDIATRRRRDGDLHRPGRTATGPHPAVLMLMDAPGIREELHDMARRLASVRLSTSSCRTSTTAPGAIQQVRPRRAAGEGRPGARPHARHPHEDDHPARDARCRPTCCAFLDTQAGCGRPGPVGVHGYCMSGPYALAAAARYPGRIVGRRLLLRHLAGQRCGGEPAPQRSDQGRAELYISCAEHDELAPLPMVAELQRALRCVRRRRASWRSVLPSTTASPSRSAGATTKQPPSGIGKG